MCLAIPGQIVEITGEDAAFRSAKADFAGIRKEISLAFTPEAAVGDYVLVHVGFALTVVSPDEAARTMEALRSLLPGDEIANDLGEHDP